MTPGEALDAGMAFLRKESKAATAELLNRIAELEARVAELEARGAKPSALSVVATTPSLGPVSMPDQAPAAIVGQITAPGQQSPHAVAFPTPQPVHIAGQGELPAS